MDPTSLPIYQRIYQDLLGLIQGGQLKPGDSIPTEKELQHQYGVSRAPVRQALSALEREGYVRRTPGRGTEVIHPQVAPWARLSGFAHHYSKLADRITIRTVRVETVPADPEVASHLGLKPGDLVLRTCRLRLVEGAPTAYIHNYFGHPLGVDIPDYLDGGDSLHQLVKRLVSREEAEVQEDLVATGAPAEVAEALGINEGSPILFVTRRGWDEERRAVEFSRYWARTDAMTYRTFLPTGHKHR